MNDPPDGDVLSLNADSLTLTAECNHVLYKPCIVININKPHLETSCTCLYVQRVCNKVLLLLLLSLLLLLYGHGVHIPGKT